MNGTSPEDALGAAMKVDQEKVREAEKREREEKARRNKVVKKK